VDGRSLQAAAGLNIPIFERENKLTFWPYYVCTSAGHLVLARIKERVA
jgi:hypothetical protein